MGELQESQGLKFEDLREGKIVLGLRCDSEENWGLFCKTPVRGLPCRGPASCGPRKQAAAHAPRHVGSAVDWFFFFYEFVNGFLI